MEAEKSLHSHMQPLLPNSVQIHTTCQAAPPQVSSAREELILLCRKFVGEAIASFVVVFTIMAVKINTSALGSDGAASLLALSLSGGLATMVAIFTVGHVSGPHINPAVTVGYTLIKHFPLELAPLYVCAQLMGSIVASLLLDVVYGSRWQLGLVKRSGTLTQAIVVEGISGFVLLFVCSSMATDTRAIGQFAGLAIGATIALDIIISGPVSGAGINPARALGPALASRDFTDVWVYVVGPIVGGMLGASTYWLLRPAAVKKQGAGKDVSIKHVIKAISSRDSGNSIHSTV
ncbi:hypothetical protein KP509_19G017300 [Ceratopteris richardii]|uniref:Uncharacterized protein n=1 Tax=Ceratopteris richardii TaxID=49495 RepID=A0A8T2SLG3_CERRI|nr:hypothetical protein KP509_19G017300 [Ceratopteris richardii]